MHDDFAVKYHIPVCALELVYLAKAVTNVDLDDWWLDVIDHIFDAYPGS